MGNFDGFSIIFSKKSCFFSAKILPFSHPHGLPRLRIKPGHVYLGAVGGAFARGRRRAAAQEGRLRGADRAENASEGDFESSLVGENDPFIGENGPFIDEHDPFIDDFF